MTNDDNRMWPEFSTTKLMVLFPFGSRMDISKHGLTDTEGYIVAFDGDELEEALEGYHFDDQNFGDLPEGPGIWVWNGFAGWTPGPDSDFCFEGGAWRRATNNELHALADGISPFVTADGV